MLVPGLPSFAELRTQGVRRLSAGSAIAQSALGHIGRLATDFLTGSSDAMFAGAVDYRSMNRLFPTSFPE
jgi:hypothetical protein